MVMMPDLIEDTYIFTVTDGTNLGNGAVDFAIPMSAGIPGQLYRAELYEINAQLQAVTGGKLELTTTPISPVPTPTTDLRWVFRATKIGPGANPNPNNFKFATPLKYVDVLAQKTSSRQPQWYFRLTVNTVAVGLFGANSSITFSYLVGPSR